MLAARAHPDVLPVPSRTVAGPASRALPQWPGVTRGGGAVGTTTVRRSPTGCHTDACAGDHWVVSAWPRGICPLVHVGGRQTPAGTLAAPGPWCDSTGLRVQGRGWEPLRRAQTRACPLAWRHGGGGGGTARGPRCHVLVFYPISLGRCQPPPTSGIPTTQTFPPPRPRPTQAASCIATTLACMSPRTRPAYSACGASARFHQGSCPVVGRVPRPENRYWIRYRFFVRARPCFSCDYPTRKRSQLGSAAKRTSQSMNSENFSTVSSELRLLGTAMPSRSCIPKHFATSQ